MFSFSIKDALNSLGEVTAAGELPNKIYVGRTQADGTQGYGFPLPPRGGEVTIPYYVEFTADNPPTGAVTLNVYGADENDSTTAPATGWVVIGELQVPAGKWKALTRPRVPVPDTEYKWFKVSVAGTGSSRIRADLTRFSH